MLQATLPAEDLLAVVFAHASQVLFSCVDTPVYLILGYLFSRAGSLAPQFFIFLCEYLKYRIYFNVLGIIHLHWFLCFFKKMFGESQSFLWGHWYYCFKLQVTSGQGFKTRVNSLVFMLHGLCTKGSQIHFWCDTCWPLAFALLNASLWHTFHRSIFWRQPIIVDYIDMLVLKDVFMIFTEVGRQPRTGANLLFGQIFLRNAWKWRIFDRGSVKKITLQVCHWCWYLDGK